ncbi:MAG: hypothetical protein PHZ24_12005 [Bacteroidales bacterium]|jgi:hypothetical protein|nr:hypothetical protein [Bacteroidales bacterium]
MQFVRYCLSNGNICQDNNDANLTGYPEAVCELNIRFRKITIDD